MENPGIGIDPAICTTSPFRNPSEKCNLERKQVESRQNVFRDTVFSVPSLDVIDVINEFCDSKMCKILDNGELLYADGDHLSIAGSEYQASKILLPFLYN